MTRYLRVWNVIGIAVLVAGACAGCRAESSPDPTKKSDRVTAKDEIRLATRPLVVAGSFSDPLVAISKKEALEKALSQKLIVVFTDQCSNLRPGLFLLAAKDRATTLATIKARIPDAYRRECLMKPDSVLSQSRDAVDSSFAKAPGTAVNWQGKDMLSRMIPIGDSNDKVLITPLFNETSNDPLEGLTSKVELLDAASNTWVVLRWPCNSPEIAASQTTVAVSCATYQVAEQSLHETTMYHRRDGKLLRKLDRCSHPRFDPTGKAFSCDFETISESGEVEVVRRSIEL